MLINPESLTTDEIRIDLNAAKRSFVEVFESEKVSQAVKDELEQHIRGLASELEKRTGENPYSLNELGIKG